MPRIAPSDSRAAFRRPHAPGLNRLAAASGRAAGRGSRTGVLVKMLSFTPGAVGPSRIWLEASWRAYESQAAANRGGSAPWSVVTAGDDNAPMSAALETVSTA